MRQKNSLPSLAVTPGPGACNPKPYLDELPVGIDKEGVYPLAKMKNSCCGLINPEPNQKKSKAPSPGPGSYENNKVAIEKNGSIVVSQCSNSRSFHFSHQGRKTFDVDSAGRSKLNIVPGPGSYSFVSDFGSELDPPTVSHYRR